MGLTERMRVRIKKIRIERDDDFRFREVTNHFAGSEIFAIERIPNTPAHAGEFLQQVVDLGQQRR